MNQLHTIGIKDDVEPKTSAAIFDDGDINSETYGRLNVKGTLFFMRRRVVVPQVDEDMIPKVIEFAREFVFNLKINSEVAAFVEYDRFLANAGNLCYLVPTFQWPDRKLKSFVRCYGLFTFFDNYLVSFSMSCSLFYSVL